MPIPFAVVGPGRLGAVLARAWSDAGLRMLGFLGRDPDRTQDALAFVGCGRALEAPELRGAAVVALTVADDALETVATQLAAAGAVRSCSLWLHTSGVHGLAPLAPLAAVGARIGALHPLAPVPDRAAGARTLPGRAALIEGPAASQRLLTTLAERAGLRPVVAGVAGVDRPLYHAACALAANGTTALLGITAELFAAAAGLGAVQSNALAGDLGGAACGLVADRGATAALSGPIVRGDAATVRAHVAALAAGPSPAAAGVYRAVMREALRLCAGRGLPSAGAGAEIARVLDGATGD